MKDRTERLVEIRDSKFGKGLFAARDLESGSVICNISGTPMTFDETVALQDRESHTLQVDTDKYIYCNIPFLFSNHSCEPNCGVNANLELFTLEKIKKGSELFWDYSTSMFERHWTMPCMCGTKSCRNVVTDFDLLPQELQLKYLQLNIVFPFIVRLMQSQYAKTA